MNTSQSKLTTDSGIPVESDEFSLTVGPGGPILLQDAYLIEQMAQFNRERITERQPHAKGSGAFGRFEVTRDLSVYTKAAVFRPGASTRLVARFSQVAGEHGYPDTVRDLRGFVPPRTRPVRPDRAVNQDPPSAARIPTAAPTAAPAPNPIPVSATTDLSIRSRPSPRPLQPSGWQAPAAGDYR